jgi:hypothetical protein
VLSLLFPFGRLVLDQSSTRSAKEVQEKIAQSYLPALLTPQQVVLVQDGLPLT